MSGIPFSIEGVRTFQRITDRALQALMQANLEARHFHHESLGSDHRLLGLVSQADRTASWVLLERGVDLKVVRLQVARIIQEGPRAPSPAQVAQTVQATKILENSVDEAGALNQDCVGTIHLLLGRLRDESCVGSEVLRKLGAKPRCAEDHGPSSGEDKPP